MRMNLNDTSRTKNLKNLRVKIKLARSSSTVSLILPSSLSKLRSILIFLLFFAHHRIETRIKITQEEIFKIQKIEQEFRQASHF